MYITIFISPQRCANIFPEKYSFTTSENQTWSYKSKYESNRMPSYQAYLFVHKLVFVDQLLLRAIRGDHCVQGHSSTNVPGNKERFGNIPLPLGNITSKKVHLYEYCILYLGRGGGHYSTSHRFETESLH